MNDFIGLLLILALAIQFFLWIYNEFTWLNEDDNEIIELLDNLDCGDYEK